MKRHINLLATLVIGFVGSGIHAMQAPKKSIAMKARFENKSPYRIYIFHSKNTGNVPYILSSQDTSGDLIFPENTPHSSAYFAFAKGLYQLAKNTDEIILLSLNNPGLDFPLMANTKATEVLIKINEAGEVKLVEVTLPKRNYYEILGVPKNASQEAIRAAYKKLALKYHPDRAAKEGYTKEEAENLFTEVNNAYEVLSNKIKRYYYDQEL